MSTFDLKPMLAGKFAEAKVEAQLPVYIQQKLDGIRCLIVDGQALSRSLKPIPNRFVQDWVNVYGHRLLGFDGELIVGDVTAPDAYRKTNSAIMSRDGTPDFTYHVFDIWASEETYDIRRAVLEQMFERSRLSLPHCQMLESHLCETLGDILNWERAWLAEGHEGAIIRGPQTLYKFGRATAIQGQLIKLKRFTDAEAVVIGFEELMHNANEATLDNLGHTIHSSHKAGKVPMNTLGALVCEYRTPVGFEGQLMDVEFRIGTGFDAATRQHIWDRQADYLAADVKFKYFGGGIKDAPRFPVFLGFRDERDT